MLPNQKIRERRLELGLDATEVAARAGLSIHEYEDIEQYPDEFISAIEFVRAKRLSAALGLKVSAILGIESAQHETSETSPKWQSLQDARISRDLTVVQLAHALGMEPWVIDRLENDEAAIDDWPIQFITELTQQLRLPLSRFVE